MNTDLILVVSEKMDNKEKTGKEESSLIRMSCGARKTMGMPYGKEINLQATPENVVKTALVVQKAFNSDMEDAEKSGQYTKEELSRIAFVTTKNFNIITGIVPHAKKAKKKEVVKFLLGADPEFLLKGETGFIAAANISPNWSKKTALGFDGAMAEVRPNPAESVEGLVNNIKIVLKDEELTKFIKKVDWLGGCLYEDDHRNYPIAGHIHIGNIKPIEDMSEHYRFSFFRIMNKILDETIAVPLIKLDGEQGKVRRTKCTYWPADNAQQGYGYFGEWRSCDGRLEYRTLSGMWLVHPSIARAVIGTTKAVIEEIYKVCAEKDFNRDFVCGLSKYRNMKDTLFSDTFNEWGEIELAKVFGCTQDSAEIKRILNESKASIVDKNFLKNWISRMKKISTYRKYAKYIEGMKEILSIPIDDIEIYPREIKANWLGEKNFFVKL